MKRYVLSKDGETPIESTNDDEWGLFMWDVSNRRVALETINGITISTIFLGIDHSYFGGSPILWETMVFDEKMINQKEDRCSGNREQAEAMHIKMVEFVRQSFNEKTSFAEKA